MKDSCTIWRKPRPTGTAHLPEAWLNMPSRRKAAMSPKITGSTLGKAVAGAMTSGASYPMVW